ncbi:YbaK/prolyl-tRNA synthetase associated domain-containing protein [Actinomadura vinacea]|uniref:YbaK/prolyl-tRNA synthetase associated domain-containing protein n=1 Tax=Actinomadura vinacea TaxID=115336 RepID=A0ABP5XKU4_9ACTN
MSGEGGAVAPGAYERLIGVLDEAGARYRLIDHAPEGRTDVVSALRGNAVADAAKCLIVMVKAGKKERRYVLAVVPGDARLDLQAVKGLVGGSYAGFAAKEKAEALAGSVSGTVLPFAFHPELELVVDPVLLEAPELFFNAGRLDRSMALVTEDYVRVAEPRLERISVRDGEAAPPDGAVEGSAASVEGAVEAM